MLAFRAVEMVYHLVVHSLEDGNKILVPVKTDQCSHSLA